MLGAYAIPIGIVWHQFTHATSTSVSQIICKNKTGIIAAMAVMAIATCAYEYQRVKCASIEHAHLNRIGFACVVSLLICIFSLVSIDESHAVHYVFAVLGFGAIIGFTLVHSMRMQTPVCAAVIATQFASCAHNAPIHNRWRHIFRGSDVHCSVRALLSVSSLLLRMRRRSKNGGQRRNLLLRERRGQLNGEPDFQRAAFGVAQSR